MYRFSHSEKTLVYTVFCRLTENVIKVFRICFEKVAEAVNLQLDSKNHVSNILLQGY